MVIFDRRSYQCTQNPNGKHSVQATTKFPATTTTAAAVTTNEDNETDNESEATTEQPLMVEVTEETTAEGGEKDAVPAEEPTSAPEGTTAKPINLPSHFTPIPCLVSF